MIDELRVFIKKVLSEPTIAVKSMEIARKYRNEPNANEIIAREISANTTIRFRRAGARRTTCFSISSTRCWMTKRRCIEVGHDY